MKMLILADDFTGAMDTGCPFAQEGLSTSVYMESPEETRSSDEVLVVDTQTRHKMPGEAYQITQGLLRRLAPQYDCIYIKTDSAFRGNLSAVLAAAVDTLGIPIHFVPSYPQVGRRLDRGMIYIGEQLLENSPFARDPRSPMQISRAADILRMDYPLSCTPVRESTGFQDVPGTQVYLYDCSSVERIWQIGEELIERNRMRLVGGCAGLAGVLAQKLSKGRVRLKPPVGEGLLIVSGSANAYTFAQLERRRGGRIVNLARETIQMENCVSCLRRGETLILAAACGPEDLVQNPSESYHIELGQTLARLTEELLRGSGVRNLAIFGGDTLQAILKRLSCSRVRICGYLEEGVPVCEGETSLGRLCLVTKSGGLGSRTVVSHIMDYYEGREGE